MTHPTVELYEVGPRDGLQNEPHPIPVADKIALIDTLSQAGLRRIEAASFVNPKRVPQMADSDLVMKGIKRADGVRYAALTPNLRGLQDAILAGVQEVAVFASASEGFSQANLNANIKDSLSTFRQVARAANTAGLAVRGYVSCVIACPYDGPTPPGQVAEVADSLRDMGCAEISLGDTIGAGTPDKVQDMITAVANRVPLPSLAGHFHDTHGTAWDNITACYDAGLRVFDTAVGGLGGCPFAPGSPGNVATEMVARRFADRGVNTGLDLAVIDRAADMARSMRRITHV